MEKYAQILFEARYKTNIESVYLSSQTIRKLYKLLGTPTYDLCDDPQRNNYSRIHGYTRDCMDAQSLTLANYYNTQPTDFGRLHNISVIKARILDEYARAGWHITISNYIVTAQKYVQHPVYPQILILFKVTRDKATYAYLLNKDYFDGR